MTSLNLKDPTLLKTQCFIDNAWVDAASNKTFVVDNPADVSKLADVADGNDVETQLAIQAAERALPAWRALTAKQRAALLKKWFDLMIANTEDLAQIVTAENGKPLAESRGEVAYGASFIEWFAEEGKRIYGDVIPPHMPDKRLIVLRQPIGVTAAITPWNFPIAMITRKAAPALAAGCTMVLKPAEQTPLSALAMAELALRAGIPKGVLNVVTGSYANAPAIGGALCASSVVRKLSFTGSTEVGRILMRQCAPTIKKLSLELGGNAPFIVFDDADLEAAADALMICKFRNAGQTCVTANRIYVQAAVYDAFAQKIAARMGSLKLGRGDAEGTNVGPLIDEAGREKAAAHVADAIAQGATVLFGGGSAGNSGAAANNAPTNLGARFFQPTLLANVPVSAKVSREETFGPVLPLIKFNTDEEAIALANDSEFGLAAYFFARDISRVFKVAEAIESGMVAINTGILSTEVAPFGGVKQSGLGREGSKYGIEDYIEMKYVCLNV
jgi:succinate-semialdehyde dehydrogenase / glutarate-semialdehyde dehydrogenase